MAPHSFPSLSLAGRRFCHDATLPRPDVPRTRSYCKPLSEPCCFETTAPQVAAGRRLPGCNPTPCEGFGSRAPRAQGDFPRSCRRRAEINHGGNTEGWRERLGRWRLGLRYCTATPTLECREDERAFHWDSRWRHTIQPRLLDTPVLTLESSETVETSHQLNEALCCILAAKPSAYMRLGEDGASCNP